MKTVFSGIVWVGRATVFTVGLAVVLALILGGATAAVAAAPGDPFRLGKVNTIDKVTKLVGQGKVPRLVVENKGNGVALRLLVEPNKPPMNVNSDAKVANLNADKLDGKDSTEFLSGSTYRVSAFRNGGLNETNFGNIYCNAGDRALSGGYGLLSQSGHVYQSEPAVLAASGWSVVWTGDTQIRMSVRCVD